MRDSTNAQEPDTDDLARQIEEAVEGIAARMPDALARRWTASPVLRPRSDASKSVGELSDPTADVALDTRRLALSEATTRAQTALRVALAILAGARADLDRAVARYDGE